VPKVEIKFPSEVIGRIFLVYLVNVLQDFLLQRKEVEKAQFIY